MKKTTTKTLVPKAFKTLQEGMNYHHQGNLTQAKSSYLRVLQLYPDQPDALHLLGVLALNNGRAGKALELIDKALSANPGAHTWTAGPVVRSSLDLTSSRSSPMR
jgi:tetratricopeptide (TPR) repeat protein